MTVSLIDGKGRERPGGMQPAARYFKDGPAGYQLPVVMICRQGCLKTGETGKNSLLVTAWLVRGQTDCVLLTHYSKEVIDWFFRMRRLCSKDRLLEETFAMQV